LLFYGFNSFTEINLSTQYFHCKSRCYDQIRTSIFNNSTLRGFADSCSQLSANLYDICHCCVYTKKLLMMDRETIRNM
jgi:hypothetical protein